MLTELKYAYDVSDSGYAMMVKTYLGTSIEITNINAPNNNDAKAVILIKTSGSENNGVLNSSDIINGIIDTQYAQIVGIVGTSTYNTNYTQLSSQSYIYTHD